MIQDLWIVGEEGIRKIGVLSNWQSSLYVCLLIIVPVKGIASGTRRIEEARNLLLRKKE